MRREKWFKQDRHNILGNFIMTTPMLKILAKKKKKPIPVYFETKYLTPVFESCPFIKVLRTKPKYKHSWSSIPPRRKLRNKGESDIEALVRIHCKFKGKIPDTYVDSSNTIILKRKKKKTYVAIFHGCYNSKNISRKELPRQTRRLMVRGCLDRGFVPVILGSKSDFKRYWTRNKIIKNNKNVVNYLGKLSLRDTVSILNQCDYFLSNDTGLYHVAGALKKKGLVLWKNTDPIKNASSFGGISHCISESGVASLYNAEIDKFLDNIKRGNI